MRRRPTPAILLAALIYVFGVALMFFIGMAHAQTSKYFSPTGKVGCWPSPIGPGIGIKTDVQTADGWGYYVGWWCPANIEPALNTKWTKSIVVTMHSSAPRFDTGMMTGLLAANPADAQAMLNKAADLARKAPTGNYVTQFDRLWEKGWSALDSTKPPEPVWAVAANGDEPDRPLYMTEAGKKTSQQVGRSAVGGLCDCKKLFIDGKWCPPSPGADYVVTMCRRQP